MIKLVYHWLKTNKVLLTNASSLIGTYVSTSLLGFIYWWLAARQYSTEAVGLASAANSAMILLGAFGIVGLGTLLIGELLRHPGEEASLISAALILVGCIGTLLGVLFAVFAPYFSADLLPLRTNMNDVLLFSLGVALTTITLVLDQALIGLLRGELQLWRNILFALIKLVLLFLAGLWLAQKTGLTIYATWALGNLGSLILLTAYLVLKRKGHWLKEMCRPRWRLLRNLGRSALEHHLLNLILQTPSQALPLLVIVLLSATMNAWFYVAYLIANVVFYIAYALTTVLYAIKPSEMDLLTHRTRVTLGLSVLTSLVACCFLFFGSSQVLALFGHTYAEHSVWCLRILVFTAFPLIIKNHFVVICRIEGRIRHTLLPIIAGSLLELSIAALGAHLAGIAGLSLGWFAAVTVEALFMLRTVIRIARPKNVAINMLQIHEYILPRSSIQLRDTYVKEPRSQQ